MSTAFLAFVALILIFLFRILNVISTPQKPIIYSKDANFFTALMKMAPLLEIPYTPTRLWGFSGHVQTIVHSVIGRFKCPWPIGERIHLTLADNSLLTYDLYQPLEHKYEDDVTLAIVPGICNTSESVYIRTFVHYAQCHGYRCAVLNHIGALSSVPVTTSRVFTYGYTNDFHDMLRHLCERHPDTKVVIIGYSMGGNIVTKYMGEKEKEKVSNLIGGISICQGYDGIQGTKWLLNWQNFRRLYLYAMTEAVKGIILRHHKILLSEEAKTTYNLNEREIISAATLPELDDAYTRKVYGFQTVEELYKWSSCINYFEGISHPMIFINSKDDPLIPDTLLEPVRQFTTTHNKTAYIEMAHGGHLGFYEGGLLYPNPISWLDRSLVAMIGAIVCTHAEKTAKPAD